MDFIIVINKYTVSGWEGCRIEYLIYTIEFRQLNYRSSQRSANFFFLKLEHASVDCSHSVSFNWNFHGIDCRYAEVQITTVNYCDDGIFFCISRDAISTYNTSLALITVDRRATNHLTRYIFYYSVSSIEQSYSNNNNYHPIPRYIICMCPPDT